MKVCGKCKILKDESEFYRNRLRSCPTFYCKSCTKKSVVAWAKNNPEKAEALSLRYRESHRKELASRTAKWYLKNKERNHRNTARWYAKNKDRGAAKSARYKLTQKLATPKWAIKFFIDEAYHLAFQRTKALGVKWSVDHIVPLKSKLVCGLHVHNNLRVIPAIDNSVKGNRVWPDMP